MKFAGSFRNLYNLRNSKLIFNNFKKTFTSDNAFTNNKYKPLSYSIYQLLHRNKLKFAETISALNSLATSNLITKNGLIAALTSGSDLLGQS